MKHGDRFPMLENKTTWQGNSLIKGANIDLEKTINDTSNQIDQYIFQNIKSGRLRDLCLRLNLDTTRWMTKLIAYIDRELREVENYGIPEAKVFMLVSNQLNTIFHSLWAKRMLMQEFSTERDETVYVARSIWITMEAHQVMEEFATLDFKSHNLISSVFIRFLAEEMGSNFASGLSGQLAQIESAHKDLKKTVESRHTGYNRRMDSHTDHIKKLCAKADIKFVALQNSSRE